jgi:hypothetical protein
VRLHGDFDAAGLAITITMEADVAVNESGKTLNGVQNGLNLQLNSWSPGRALALFRNWQTTRFLGDQLCWQKEAACSRRLWAGAASGGDGLSNSSSRRRRSPRVTDSPAPAQRRGKGVRIESSPVKTNTWKDQKLPKITHKSCYRPKDIYVSTISRALSEICLPIKLKGEVRCLLNVEDSNQNTFLPKEKTTLEEVRREVTSLLKTTWLEHFVKTLESASDAFIVTENDGRIKEVYGRTDLFAPTPVEMIGQPLQGYLKETDAAKNLFNANGPKTAEVVVVRGDATNCEMLFSVAVLPPEIGGKIFVGKDLRAILQAGRSQGLERLYSEVICQARTPLSLVSAWVQDLADTEDKDTRRDILDKIERQLRQVDISYDRILLAGRLGKAVPHNPILLEAGELVEALQQDFPAQLWNESIRVNLQAADARLRGDLFQLLFCLRTIVSYFLRYAPEKKPVKIALQRADELIEVSITGVLPADIDIPDAPIQRRVSLSQSFTDLELGKAAIEEFLGKNGGALEGPRRDGEMVRFVFKLPAEK